VGDHSGNLNQGGIGSAAFGYQAMQNNVSGNNNAAFGADAMSGNTGSGNTGLGFAALSASTATITAGNFNSAVGYEALIRNTGGAQNTGIGSSAGLLTSTGSFNSFLGYSAGSANTTGSNNTFLGYTANAAGANAATLVDATAIGSGATVTTNSTMILGDNTVNVGIGYSGSALTAATKFDVLYNTGTAFSSGPVYNGHFINSNTISGTTNPYVYGLYGAATATESNSSVYHYGIGAVSSGATNCVGLSSVSTGNTSGGRVYGGYFNASGAGVAGTSGINYAVYATVGSNATLNYGIYSTVSSYATGNYAGYFNGDVYVNGGSNSGTGWLTASDRQFKTNIKTISNPADIFKKLTPRSYYYDTTANNGMHFSAKKQYGFIAQELEEVLPELVYNVKKPSDVDKDGKVIHEAINHKAVNYDGLIALLIAQAQAQQTQNDAQDSTIKALQKQISQLLANNTQAGNTNANAATASVGAQGVSLSDADVVVLNQNTPNPFAEQTVITYVIPQSAGTAQIIFYDMSGKQVKSTNIAAKGKGSLTVYANDLTNGMYSYSLVVDGKVIDTKKMVKQQ